MTAHAGFHTDPPRVTCATPECDVELLAARASAAAWSESSSPWLCSMHNLERRCPSCTAPVAISNDVVRFAHYSWCPHAPRPTRGRTTLAAPTPALARLTADELDQPDRLPG